MGTAYNIFKLFETTGEVDHRKPPPRPQKRKLDNHHELYIIGLILDCPTLQLSELVDKVEEISGTHVAQSTLCRLLAKYGFTRKTVQRVASQRSVDLRGAFIASVYNFTKDMFVYIDETGSKLKDMLRRYGYAMCGDRAENNTFLVRGQTITSIAAISTDGLLAVEITTGKVNGEVFLDFLRGSLIPELCPFDGCNPRSIIIMDNCSIHRVQEVIDFYLEIYLQNWNSLLMLRTAEHTSA